MQFSFCSCDSCRFPFTVSQHSSLSLFHSSMFQNLSGRKTHLLRTSLRPVYDSVKIVWTMNNCHGESCLLASNTFIRAAYNSGIVGSMNRVNWQIWDGKEDSSLFYGESILFTPPWPQWQQGLRKVEVVNDAKITCFSLQLEGLGLSEWESHESDSGFRGRESWIRLGIGHIMYWFGFESSSFILARKQL